MRLSRLFTCILLSGALYTYRIDIPLFYLRTV